MRKTIFLHYQKTFKKTIEEIPLLIQLTFEYLSESIEIENLLDLQQNRLSDTGKYIDGKSLQTDSGALIDKPYSELTDKNGHVDLYDTGEFYESMKVIAKSFELEFSADFEKEDSNISDNFQFQKNADEFVQDVLGLTAENWNQIRPHFVEKFIELFTLKFNKLI